MGGARPRLAPDWPESFKDLLTRQASIDLDSFPLLCVESIHRERVYARRMDAVNGECAQDVHVWVSLNPLSIHASIPEDRARARMRITRSV